MNESIVQPTSEPSWFPLPSSVSSPQAYPELAAMLDKLEALFTTWQVRRRLETPEPQQPAIHPDLIINQVAVSLYVERDQILGASRTQHTVFVRQVAMYLVRELTAKSFPAIGKIFGNRNHSTVMHNIGVIRRRLADAKHGASFSKLIAKLETQITETMAAA